MEFLTESSSLNVNNPQVINIIYENNNQNQNRLSPLAVNFPVFPDATGVKSNKILKLNETSWNNNNTPKSVDKQSKRKYTTKSNKKLVNSINENYSAENSNENFLNTNIDCLVTNGNKVENFSGSNEIIPNCSIKLPKKRGPKKKPLTKEREVRLKNRRVRANARERSRMHGLNHALELLRNHVPTFSNTQRLSKIETLRLAKNYIHILSELLTRNKPLTPVEMALYLTDGLSQNTSNLIATKLQVSPRIIIQMKRDSKLQNNFMNHHTNIEITNNPDNNDDHNNDDDDDDDNTTMTTSTTATTTTTTTNDNDRKLSLDDTSMIDGLLTMNHLISQQNTNHQTTLINTIHDHTSLDVNHNKNIVNIHHTTTQNNSGISQSNENFHFNSFPNYNYFNNFTLPIHTNSNSSVINFEQNPYTNSQSLPWINFHTNQYFPC